MCCIFGSSWCIKEVIFLISFIVSKNVLKIVPRLEKAKIGENCRYPSRLFSTGLQQNRKSPETFIQLLR